VLFTINQLASGPSAKHVHRTKLIWLLASRLALRREEIANLRASDFSMSSSKRRWILRIKGKGRLLSDETDIVVVPDEVMLAIGAYRTSIGKYQHPLPSESAPLLLRLAHEKTSRPGAFISPEHIARIMKTIFRMAAKDAGVRLQNVAMEERLLQASIHWGRHTWFVNALKKHPIHLVSLGGRHKDIRTTQRSYVSLTEDDLAKLTD
jgi:integrase